MIGSWQLSAAIFGSSDLSLYRGVLGDTQKRGRPFRFIYLEEGFCQAGHPDLIAGEGCTMDQRHPFLVGEGGAAMKGTNGCAKSNIESGLSRRSAKTKKTAFKKADHVQQAVARGGN